MFERFWRQNPALLYGLALFLGYHSAITPLVAIPIAAILLPLLFARSWERAVLVVLLLLCSHTQHNKPDIPEEGVFGEGHFVIKQICQKRTHFGSQWVYSGVMRTFGQERNIPCSLKLRKQKEKRPSANRSYLIKGVLMRNDHGGHYLIPDKESAWKPVKNSWGLAEIRYRFKNRVEDYIKRNINDPQAATFLSGLATGNFDDPLLKFEFSRLGLQHIMAISGFHFAIIASILSIALNFFIREKVANLMLIFVISSYFLFLGESPSIIRAWIMIVVALIAQTVKKEGTGLNALGVAIVAIMLYEPHLSEGLGFSFSFLTTVSILLFYPIFDALLPRRRLSQLVHMEPSDQHGYLVLSIFRQALALALAVNLIAIPLTLFIFQIFPMLSLVYNLFFPFLVSLSMLLLLLGPLFHTLNSVYTTFILGFVSNVPISVNPTIEMESFPPIILTVYFTGIFLWGVYMKRKLENQREEIQDLVLC